MPGRHAHPGPAPRGPGWARIGPPEVSAPSATGRTVTGMSSPAPEPRGYDLTSFLRSVGSPSLERALMTELPERPECEGAVELLEDSIAQVTAAPMKVAAWLDGVQNAIIVTHREHRGIWLSWAAAGAVGAGAKFAGFRQRLVIMCSTVDREWLEERSPAERRPPFEELTASAPPDLERQAVQLLGRIRERLEVSLVEDLIEQGVGPLVVDGSLIGRTHHPELHGVVKTTRRRYLADESILYNLPAGYRSPLFKIAAGTDGVPVDRYSCYLRLHDARTAPWDFALIRLESFRPEALDPLAARALCERQGQGSGDHRYDRHLAAVAEAEDVLRAFRPAVFEL